MKMLYKNTDTYSISPSVLPLKVWNLIGFISQLLMQLSKGIVMDIIYLGIL